MSSMLDEGRPDAAAAYVTDGVFLFRVAGWIGTGAEAAVELEDCYALDVVTVPIRDLPARGLHVVTRSAG